MQDNKNMTAGAKNRTGKKSPISRENGNKILRAYIALYNVFLRQNLMSGKTLGASSYAALKLLGTKIATMDGKNPVTKLLTRIHKYHSEKITKIIMTSKYRDARARVGSDQREKLLNRASTMFADANNILKTLSAQYKPKTVAKNPVALSPELVTAAVQVSNKQQPLKQTVNLVLWLRQNQRSAA